MARIRHSNAPGSRPRNAAALEQAIAAPAVTPGNPAELGATPDENGVNFAVFSSVATKVELCLFDAAGTETRIALPEKTEDGIWHGHVAGLKPGQKYGYRVHGPYEPHNGHRCNPNKLLVDPYARAVDGEVTFDVSNFGFEIGKGTESFDRRDNAAFMPKGVVSDESFDWAGEARPNRAMTDSIIYEAHIAGMSKDHAEVPEALRGTAEGLADPAILKHLKDLGVTAIELLPLQAFADEPHLQDTGLSNYWGYNPYNYFAPHPKYLGEEGNASLKKMVKALHDNGQEVIVDVVYNHTGEGGAAGPTLSLKGFDNAAYYRLNEANKAEYVDDTGCGNKLDMDKPMARRLALDSLRYWVEEMHVDGFRFDLAESIATEAFLKEVREDPVLSKAKLIAEPWSIGGYGLGRFGEPWHEWNDTFRDTVRSFWKGDPGLVGAMADKLTGTASTFGGRQNQASVNFVTAHDGFTLADLVAYDHKHNENNQEGNRDGSDSNRSWNHGAEGPTDDPAILAARQQTKRNIMATLLLSQGTPMLLAGDEFGNAQGGNNNVYCQDNDIAWVNWQRMNADDRDFLEFSKKLTAIRRDYPEFRNADFFSGRAGAGGEKDIEWRAAAGEMQQSDWETGYAKSFGFVLPRSDGSGEKLFVAMNAHDGEVAFKMPGGAGGQRWQPLFDTARPKDPTEAERVDADGEYRMHGRSMALFKLTAEPPKATPKTQPGRAPAFA